MAAYDPQRTRNRPTPAADRPSPVDALLDAAPVTTLPDGIDLEVTAGGETIMHTADADIEIDARGDDVIVTTADSRVEVLAEQDTVVIDAAGEEILVDTTPRGAFDASDRPVAPIVSTSDDRRPRLLVAVGAVALVAIVVALLARRRRH